MNNASLWIKNGASSMKPSLPPPPAAFSISQLRFLKWSACIASPSSHSIYSITWFHLASPPQAFVQRSEISFVKVTRELVWPQTIKSSMLTRWACCFLRKGKQAKFWNVTVLLCFQTFMIATSACFAWSPLIWPLNILLASFTFNEYVTLKNYS